MGVEPKHDVVSESKLVVDSPECLAVFKAEIQKCLVCYLFHVILILFVLLLFLLPWVNNPWDGDRALYVLF